MERANPPTMEETRFLAEFQMVAGSPTRRRRSRSSRVTHRRRRLSHEARAAGFLGITRPTLDGYLQHEAEGRLSAIPGAILANVGIHADSEAAPVSPRREAGGSPYDMVNLFSTT